MKRHLNWLSVGLFAAATMLHSASAEVLYDNLQPDNRLGIHFNTGTGQYGDEIILQGDADAYLLTSFRFAYYGSNLGPNAQMQVSFYGTYDSSTQTPGALIWQSDPFVIENPDTDEGWVTFDTDYLGNVEVPQSFTWTLQLSNVPDGGSGGVVLYSPPVVGNNYTSYWSRTEEGWQLLSYAGAHADFGALVEGVAVPEPTTFGLLAVGGAVALLGRKKLLPRR